MRGLAVATFLSLVLAAVLGAGGLPFDRPAVGTTDMTQNIILQVVQLIFALLVIGVTYAVTRKRAAVDFDSWTPEKRLATQEAIGLLIYGTVVLFVGGLNGIRMHLHGAVFGARGGAAGDWGIHRHVQP